MSIETKPSEFKSKFKELKMSMTAGIKTVALAASLAAITMSSPMANANEIDHSISNAQSITQEVAQESTYPSYDMLSKEGKTLVAYAATGLSENADGFPYSSQEEAYDYVVQNHKNETGGMVWTGDGFSSEKSDIVADFDKFVNNFKTDNNIENTPNYLLPRETAPEINQNIENSSDFAEFKKNKGNSFDDYKNERQASMDAFKNELSELSVSSTEPSEKMKETLENTRSKYSTTTKRMIR